MLAACVLLAFFAAVIPVNNGLTQKCHLTCKKTELPSLKLSEYMTEFLRHKTLFVECLIQTPQTSNCTLDVSELFPCPCKQHEFLHLELVCETTQYRPIITNKQNIPCDTYHSHLAVKRCGLLWQDLDVYGELLPLTVLYLKDWEDPWDEEFVETDYWKKFWVLRDEGVVDLQTEPALISHGLREVMHLQIVNMDNTPKILQEFIWPSIYKLVFINIRLSSQITNICFQTNFPKLQNLEVISCNLTQPPLHVYSDDDITVLPGNLSFTEKVPDAEDVWKNNFPISLKLDGNRITDLSNYIMKGNLTEISLKENNLSRVNANLFTKLKGLTSIDLSRNKLSSVPPRLLWNQHELSHVSLAENILAEIPAVLFKSLPSLEHVDLSSNLLTDIPAGLFRSLSSLEHVHLGANSLTGIPAGLFKSLRSLKQVDLSFNSITDIPTDLFTSLPSLAHIDLNNNLLTFINSFTFQNLGSLTKINLAANQLKYIADYAISPSLNSLKHANLSKNQLTTIPTSIFVLPNLQDADLSENYITYESIKDTLKNLTQISMSHRFLQKLHDKPMPFLSFLSNNISTIEMECLNNNYISLVSFIFQHFIVSLDHLVCDCKLYTFYKLMHSKEKQWMIHDLNKQTLKCKKPDHLHDKLLYDLDPSNFVCEENIPLCPDNCTCFRRSMDEAIIVSCEKVLMPSFPNQLPEETTELDLSGNLITQFHSRYLYLAKIEKLNLRNNHINSIFVDVLDFLAMSHIKELQLNQNRLRDLPHKIDVLMGTNLSHLTLGNNPWECTCHTAWMKNWLIARRDIIQDLDKVLCVTGIPTGQVYTEFIEHPFNCTTPADIVVRNALIGIGAFFVMCVIVVLLIYKYRGEIKILLYVHFNWHPFDATENADILDMQYDVFISYSGLDYRWVCFKLLPKLENHNPPYRVCLHDRDFMPGAYIENNIMEAVQSSRRMILVLSQNYLKSEWCMVEFRAAHTKVLNDRTNYLILVLYDDVNVSELDEDMKLYIRTNTYLARSNKWFYDKLLYSMPTKSLEQLRKEMENKMVKNNSVDSLDHRNIEQRTSSSQFASEMDALIKK